MRREIKASHLRYILEGPDTPEAERAAEAIEKAAREVEAAIAEAEANGRHLVVLNRDAPPTMIELDAEGET